MTGYLTCPRCDTGHNFEAEPPELCSECEWCFGDELCSYCADEPVSAQGEYEHCGRQRCKAEHEQEREQP